MRAADRVYLCEPCKDGKSGFLGELLEDGHTDECAGMIEPTACPKGVKKGT